MVLFRLVRLTAALLSVCSLVLLDGCSVQSTSIHTAAGISGRVHGGQQPVVGATIQLYTVGTTGDGSAATPLLTQPVQTDQNGAFNITGLYSCTNSAQPSLNATEVYLTATGGNPGLGSGQSNPNLALMAALGPCSSLTSSTFISVNELTTIAAAAALAPYATSYTAIGSAPGDATTLAQAFELAAELVNPSTGTSPGDGVPAGIYVPTSEINTLGNILATCVNSAGGLAGSLTPCGALFLLTTPTSGIPPTDTIAAALLIQQNPTRNLAALFALASSNGPFQPQLPVAPVTFLVALQPGLALSPSPLRFPDIAVGGTGDPRNGALVYATLALTNYTSNPVIITSATFATQALPFFTISADNCGSLLAAYATCTYQVQLLDLIQGPNSVPFTVVSNSPSSPTTVAVESYGTTPATLIFTDSPLSFGGQPIGSTSSTRAATITNTSEGGIQDTYTVVGFTGANPTDFSIVSDGCGGTPPSDLMTCPINIAFTPGALGPRSATLTLQDVNSDTPFSISLLGVGISNVPSPLVFSSSSLTFYAVGTIYEDLTVTNSGTTPVPISSITYSTGSTPANNCGPSLDPSASCTIAVIASTGGLTIDTTAPGGAQTIALNASGTSLVFFAPAFPDTAVGASSTVPVEFLDSNDANGNPNIPLSTFSGTIAGTNASDFTPPTITGTSNILSTPPTVTFTPSAVGLRTARIYLTFQVPYGEPTGPANLMYAPIAGTGTSPP